MKTIYIKLNDLQERALRLATISRYGKSKKRILKKKMNRMMNDIVLAHLIEEQKKLVD